MNGFLKVLSCLEAFRDAFDDLKHPTFESSTDDEFRVDDSDSDVGCYYTSPSYSSSSCCGSDDEDDEVADDDSSYDPTADNIATCVRLGHIMGVVNHANGIAARRR